MGGWDCTRLVGSTSWGERLDRPPCPAPLALFVLPFILICFAPKGMWLNLKFEEGGRRERGASLSLNAVHTIWEILDAFCTVCTLTFVYVYLPLTLSEFFRWILKGHTQCSCDVHLYGMQSLVLVPTNKNFHNGMRVMIHPLRCSRISRLELISPEYVLPSPLTTA